MYVNSALPANLLREDVDLKDGYAVTRGTAKKARKNSGVPLHPIVVRSLRTIAGFNVEVFPGSIRKGPFGDRFVQSRLRLEFKRPVAQTICRADSLPRMPMSYPHPSCKP